MIMGHKVSEIRKALVALTGGLVILITSLGAEFAQWMPTSASAWIASTGSVLTAVGVYLTKNAEVIDGVDEL